MKYDGRVNIYIKKEDRAMWDAIENRAEWLRLMIKLYGQDPVSKFAAFIAHDNKRLKHLINHTEKVNFDGLGAIIDDSTETSTYEFLGVTSYADMVSNSTSAAGVLTEAYLEEQYNKARDAGKPDVSIPEMNAIKRTPPEESA